MNVFMHLPRRRSHAGLLAPLLARSAVIIPAGGRFSAKTFWKDACHYRATFYTAVPTMHQVSATPGIRHRLFGELLFACTSKFTIGEAVALYSLCVLTGRPVLSSTDNSMSAAALGLPHTSLREPWCIQLVSPCLPLLRTWNCAADSAPEGGGGLPQGQPSPAEVHPQLLLLPGRAYSAQARGRLQGPCLGGGRPC